MATIITKTDGMNLTDVNGFYQVVYANITNRSSTAISLSSSYQYIEFTASANGNFKGLFLQTYGGTTNISRSIACLLQENVAGTWTTRASQVTDWEIIKGGSIGHTLGTYYGKMEFTTGYAIDTTAGKWRIGIAQSVAGVGTVQLGTSNGTLATSCISVYTDTSVSYASGNVILFANNITVNSAMTLGSILGNGLTANPNYSSGAMASGKSLQFSEGVAGYTVTIPGYIERCTNDGWLVGSSISRIPSAKQIKFVFNSAALTPRGGRYLYLNTSSRFHLGTNTKLYGEVPTITRAVVIAPADTGQKNITIDVATGWTAGMKVRMSTKGIKGATETTDYQVASVAGNVITLNVNITKAREIGDDVMIISGRGILLSTEDEMGTGASNYTVHTLYSPNADVMDGVDIRNQSGLNNAGTGTLVTNFYGKLYSYNKIVERVMTQCGAINTQATVYYISSSTLLPNCETYYTNNNLYRCTPLYSTTTYNTKDYKTGLVHHNDNLFINEALPTLNIPYGNPVLEVLRNTYNNSSGNSLYISGIGSVYEDNKFYGGVASFICYYNAINCVVENHIYSNNNVNMYAISGIVASTKELNPTYALQTTYTASYVAGALFDLDISNSTGEFTSNPVTILETTSGSKLSVVNNDSITGNYIVYSPDGTTIRSGVGVADTTVYGTDCCALRQESFGTPITYSINSPMGNKLGKAMTVSVYCNIASANYYAGTHILPKLKVEYDGGLHTVYAQASSQVGWQWLSLGFVPKTDNPEVTISLTSETDATGSDAYVYFGHMEGNLPNINSMNSRAKALPILDIGQLETSAGLVSNSVWNYNTALLTGIGTIGNYLKTRLLWILGK